ncbi:MAG TPA: membrane protein insertase YidC, partial [Xanthobacteraceae bacterium]
MTDHKNTILAIVLSALVLIAWQYFIGLPQVEKQRQEGQLRQQQQQAGAPVQQPGQAAPVQQPGQAAPATPPGAPPAPGQVAVPGT